VTHDGKGGFVVAGGGERFDGGAGLAVDVQALEQVVVFGFEERLFELMSLREDRRKSCPRCRVVPDAERRHYLSQLGVGQGRRRRRRSPLRQQHGYSRHQRIRLAAGAPQCLFRPPQDLSTGQTAEQEPAPQA
jgi:hypothetical protein